jgi:hypothetical protein
MKDPPSERLPLPPDPEPTEYFNTPIKAAHAALQELIADLEISTHYKQALDTGYDTSEEPDYGVNSLINVPMIPADQFTQTVWRDGNTPVSIRAATTGLVDSASAIRGGSRLVTPGDIARIAIGAGAGYASGMLVGKTLGALAGLRPESQRQLQTMGTWAGILANVVPTVF